MAFRTTTLGKFSCLLFGAFFLSVSGCKQPAPPPLPPLEVPYVEAMTRDIPISQEFVGQTYGTFDIAIRARVEGFLEGMHFREGSRVRKGQLLYTIDSQPFQAKVAERASSVAEANTLLVKAKSDLDRIRPLAEINAVSQSDLDAAEAQYGAAQASLEAAEAMLRLARIEMGYTRISAPISGIIGKTEAKVGDFVGREPNPVVLNTISRIDTILVRFSITEAEYLRFVRYAQAQGRNIEDPRMDRADLELILADGSVHDYKGHLDFANREIDPTTGTLLLQASFPNPKGIIRPGQYARVRGVVDVLQQAVLVPQRSVKELQGNYQIFIINDSSKVELRTVEMGPKVGNLWAVNSGLKPGEKVIYEGIQRVSSGASVQPVTADFEVINN